MWVWSPDRIPCPQKALDYDKTFQTEDRTVRTHLANATDARVLLAKALEAKRADPTSMMNACERYLPYISSCMATLAANAQTRYRDGPPKIAWSSGVHSKSTAFPIADIKLEYCMLLATMGYLRMRQAGSTVANVPPSHPTFDEAVKHAGQLLRQAAGLMEAAAGAGFLNLPVDRPPEMLPSICAGLSRLALAELQRLAVAKGATGGSGRSMLARLSLGAQQAYEAANAALRASGADYGELSSGLRRYVEEMHALTGAMALFYAAEDAYAKQEFGRAVGYAQLAAKTVARMNPSSSLLDPAAKASVQAFVKGVLSTCDQYTKENDGIYFGVIPPPAELQLPAPLEMQNLGPVPFSPPPPLFTSM